MSSTTPPARPRPARHATRAARRRTPSAFVIAALAVVVFAGSAFAAVWQTVQGSIRTEDIDDILGSDRPSDVAPGDPLAGGDLNVLVLGTDYRGGANAAYGDAEGMRSDTTMLVHVSADRARVDIVSVPRDLIVAIPSCELPNGESTRSYTANAGNRFNAAFALGGQGDDMRHAAACTVKTFEQMSGVYVDDFAVIDMDGFTKMVNAIGGIEMCLDRPLQDSYSDLDLPAGCPQTLNGDQALALARARHGIGDGSDIGRISRQQELMSAVAGKVFSARTLTNPSALMKFLTAATSSLTTSERLGNLNTLVGLGYSLRGLDGEHLTFTTIPFDYAGNVVKQNAAGAAMWQRLAADQPITDLIAAVDPANDPSGGISSGVAPSATPTTEG